MHFGSLMGVYSIRHSTERCNRWMACYSQTFTKTFYAINFVCCALWMLTHKKNFFFNVLTKSCIEAIRGVLLTITV